MKRIVFKNIIVAVPKKEIYRRLGYRDKITKISLGYKDEIERYIIEALSLIRVKGLALRMRISQRNSDYVFLAKGVFFKSRNLALLLKGSCETLLMAVTSGSKIMQAIKKDVRGNNLMRAVVFDAVASEMTDAGLDWMMAYFNQQLLREKKYLTLKRFSCGYGDFILQNQKLIYRLLNLKSIGVKITKDSILIPEKSASAVAGIIKL